MVSKGYPRCVVCDKVAEVSHPDGYGDQLHYCAEHEPPTLLTELEKGSTNGNETA